MITITIKENSKQAKAVIEMLKTFSFVEIKDHKISKTKKSKSKSAIDISLEEEKKGKINFYKDSNELFNKILNV